MNLFELTKKLISIPSPTGKEQKVTQFIKDYLETAGFIVRLQDVVDGRCNLYAYIDEPIIVFTTHMDTVSPIISTGEDEEFLFGRGACDAKGSLAAQIKAAEQLQKQGLKDVGLLFLIGEESGSNGARAANTLDNKCKYFINGEPTDNKLAVASMGALRIELETTGRTAHSAHPEQGESAIVKLLNILTDLQKTDYPIKEDLGETTLNIGVIKGGTHANVVADQAHAEMMFRTVNDAATLKNLIENVIAKRADIQYKYESDPVYMESIEGFETSVVSFTTDVPILTNWGQPFLLGPGSILDAHTAGEKIEKQELNKAVDLYIKLVCQLLSR
ncbi:M20/M25/M40 family metallo-hydrolase [bacterium]